MIIDINIEKDNLKDLYKDKTEKINEYTILTKQFHEEKDKDKKKNLFNKKTEKMNEYTNITQQFKKVKVIIDKIQEGELNYDDEKNYLLESYNFESIKLINLLPAEESKLNTEEKIQLKDLCKKIKEVIPNPTSDHLYQELNKKNICNQSGGSKKIYQLNLSY